MSTHRVGVFVNHLTKTFNTACQVDHDPQWDMMIDKEARRGYVMLDIARGVTKEYGKRMAETLHNMYVDSEEYQYSTRQDKRKYYAILAEEKAENTSS